MSHFPLVLYFLIFIFVLASTVSDFIYALSTSTSQLEYSQRSGHADVETRSPSSFAFQSLDEWNAFERRLEVEGNLDTQSVTNMIEQNLKVKLLERIQHLSSITENPSAPGVTRPFFSRAGTRARHAILQMMTDSGLTAHVDSVGNVIGDLKCSNSSMFSEKSWSKRGIVLMASHFDSVPQGGIWDGSYGIIAAIGVMETLKTNHICNLPFDLQVAAFDDEEGASGFSVTNFGAKSFAGVLNVSTDIADPIQFADRFASFFNLNLPKHITSASLIDALSARVQDASIVKKSMQPYVAGLELHIEQGPALQRSDHSVAAVSAIAGQTRLRVVWKGEKAHAGTVAMDSRHDALIAASAAVLLVEKIAVEQNNDCSHHEKSCMQATATVGKLDIINSGTNVVPGEVHMSVDIRAAKDVIRTRMIRTMMNEFHKISRNRHVSVDIQTVHDVKAVQMSQWVTNVLQNVVDSPSTLVSGAGHDTQFVSKVTSNVGMLFVRCKDGISHSPDEFVNEYDAFKGALSLLEAVKGLAIAVENNNSTYVV